MTRERRTKAGADDGRRAVTLKRELWQRGELKRPGETVRLRPDQIDRLRPEGYFEENGK